MMSIEHWDFAENWLIHLINMIGSGYTLICWQTHLNLPILEQVEWEVGAAKPSESHPTIESCPLQDASDHPSDSPIGLHVYLVGGMPTPLKNDGVRQLGWWHSQYDSQN